MDRFWTGTLGSGVLVGPVPICSASESCGTAFRDMNGNTGNAWLMRGPAKTVFEAAKEGFPSQGTSAENGVIEADRSLQDPKDIEGVRQKESRGSLTTFTTTISDDSAT